MTGMLKDWQTATPNHRQLHDYCGQLDFDEIRFAQGRGRAAFRKFCNDRGLRSFLLSSTYVDYPVVRVVIQGCSTRLRARVRYDHDSAEIQIVAENGFVVYKVSAPRSEEWEGPSRSEPSTDEWGQFEYVRFAMGRGRAEGVVFTRADKRTLRDFLVEGGFRRYRTCRAKLCSCANKVAAEVNVCSDHIALQTKNGDIIARFATITGD